MKILLNYFPGLSQGFPKAFPIHLADPELQPSPGEKRMSSKAKSGLFVNNKNTQGALQVSRTNRNGSAKSDTRSPSPLERLPSAIPKPRVSVDRRPKSLESKITNKNGITDKQLQAARASELQEKLDKVEIELKKAREQLDSREQVKAKAVEELIEAKRSIDEMNEKLQQATAARMKAEESLETEKSKINEMEQAGKAAVQKEEELQMELKNVEEEKAKAIEELNEEKRLTDDMNEKLQQATAARIKGEESLEIEKIKINELEEANKGAIHREEELLQELANVQSQHDEDIRNLNTMTQELQKMKTELIDMRTAKEVALREADDANKAAKSYEDKADLLSKEISRLKAFHESELDNVKKEAKEAITKLDTELSVLKLELERTKITEQKLVQMEALVEKLQIEATDARKSESDASMLVDEWRKKAEVLKAALEEACQSEKSASDSLAAMMVQLEEAKSLFDDAKSQTLVLQGRINALETDTTKQKIDLEESDRQLDLAQQDALNIGRTVELLKLELQKLEEERLQANKSEQVAASTVESLKEGNNKLNNELKISRDGWEKDKNAIECLASKLQSMSTEAREKEERLSRMQAEIEESQREIDHLHRVLRNTEERYEVMLDEARYEIVCLKKVSSSSESEASEPRTEWNAKELNSIDTIRKLEEEISCLRVEMEKMADLHEVPTQEIHEGKVEVAEMLMISAKETGLQLLTQEDGDLCTQQTLLMLQAKELPKSLKQETEKKTPENYEISNGKEYNQGKGSLEVLFKEIEDHYQKDQKKNEEDTKATNFDKVEQEEVLGNGLASKMNHEESIDDNQKAKINGNDTNVTDTSIEDEPNKQQQNHKKKKALLNKFGSLLKKGNY